MGAILRLQFGHPLLLPLHRVQVSQFRYDVPDGHREQWDVERCRQDRQQLLQLQDQLEV